MFPITFLCPMTCGIEVWADWALGMCIKFLLLFNELPQICDLKQFMFVISHFLRFRGWLQFNFVLCKAVLKTSGPACHIEAQLGKGLLSSSSRLLADFISLWQLGSATNQDFLALCFFQASNRLLARKSLI